MQKQYNSAKKKRMLPSLKLYQREPPMIVLKKQRIVNLHSMLIQHYIALENCSSPYNGTQLEANNCARGTPNNSKLLSQYQPVSRMGVCTQSWKRIFTRGQQQGEKRVGLIPIDITICNTPPDLDRVCDIITTFHSGTS